MRAAVIIGLAIAVLCVPILARTPVSPLAQHERVRLHVTDIDSGVPIVHARLASLSTPPLPPTVTDERGDVAVDVPSGGRTVRVSKAGYAPQAVPLTAAADTVDVRLERGAAITGRLVDALGAPVAGRPVRVTAQADRDPRTYQAATNDRGEYRVGALPEGTYTVTLGPLAAGTPAPPEAVEHTVTVRRGDDVGGIDFTTPLLACVIRAAASPAPPRTSDANGGILGRVVSTTAAPVPCVDVIAYRGGNRVGQAMTDADGRYAMTRLSEGAYSIEFRRAGFVTSQWGQQQRGTPGRPVQLRRDEQLRNIDSRLLHGGAITGTLLDEFLEPADNVTVRALELRGEDDRPMAVATASVQTDERGRYRLFGLFPGRYIVATAAASDPADPRTGKGYAPAYFPGVTDIALARAVDVVEEQDREWVDFPREPVRVVTVTGTALNARNEPVTDRVLLVASQRSGAVITDTQGADVTGLDGTFTIPNVPPGDYVIQATSKRPDTTSEFGMQYVTIDADVDPPPVRIKTAAGLDVQGRLMEEGSPLVDPRSFGLTAVPTDWDQTSVLAGLQTLTPAGDGTLTLTGVTGPRRFVLTTSPPNWYLKSIRLRGRDVTDEVTGFPLSGFGFIRDLEVVVSNRGATIEGDAADGSAAATDFSVVLFSSNPNHWFRHSRFVKSVRGGTAGRFRIEGVPDGDYFIAAVDALDGSAGGAWQNREFLQGLVPTARRVRLREGDERNLTLALTHR